MNRIILDTNVLVTGLISSKGPPGRIIDLLRQGSIRLVLDDRIFFEYQNVLSRPYFEKYFTLHERVVILDYLFENSEKVVSGSRIQGLPDPSDAPLLEVADIADVTLVTGNLKHFPKKKRGKVSVQTPSEFLAKP